MTRRIALAILLTVWVILIAGCATAYLSMRSILIDQLDQSIIAKARSLPELRLASPAGGAREERTTVSPSRTPAAALVDGSDHYVVKNAAGQTLSPPAGGLAAADISIVSASFSTLADGARRRSLTLRASTNGPDGAAVPVTINFQSKADDLDAVLNRVAISLALFGLGAGLVAAFVALRVSRAALRPLHATAQVIGTIDPQHLDRRIEVSSLPSELAPMAQRLNEMLERIERAYSQRQQFLADASHELRTPVAALVTTAEVSLRHPRQAESYRQTLESCLQDAKYLRRLVERLMEQCRADTLSHDEIPQEIDLSPLLTQCAAQAAALGCDRQVEVTCNYPPEYRFITQAQRLRSIITNLLSNAVEYNRPGGSVALSAHPEGHLLHLSVRDTGPGIAPEHVPHLFEPFYRADRARSSAAGHLGLGLSLVQSHLQALGGVIRVESIEGSGTAFYVDLPIQQIPHPTPITQTPTPTTRSQHPIAIEVHTGET